MAGELECAICLEIPVDPHTPPGCKHYYCKPCFERLVPNEGSLLCPQCRQPFKLADIIPYNIPNVEMRYCLDITCTPDSGCTKVHIGDLCPKISKSDKSPLTLAEKELQNPAKVDAEDTFKIPPTATYCYDITCPGGPKAKCGKKHESDLLIGPLAS